MTASTEPTAQEAPTVELLLTVLLAVVVLVGFDLVALRYGVDSRPGIGDDHQPFTPRWT